jgi:hypothetical protein
MRIVAGILVAELIMAGTALPAADAAEPGRASLDAPIRDIELDAGGNVTRILFSNGAELGLEELELDPSRIKLGEVQISGIRQLPFQVMKEGDSIVLVADFVGKTPIPVPSGKGVLLGIRQDGGVEFSLAHNPCPGGYCSLYGGPCQPCPWTSSAITHFPALVEYIDPLLGEPRFGVLQARLEYPKP